MNIVTTIKDWLAIKASLPTNSIGLIPTMGNLHAGHLSLCKRAQKENAITVVTIFVNPTQFNQATDFDLYPRTLEQDLTLLDEAKIDYVLLFEQTDLYPDNYEIQVEETQLSTMLEGINRPGHFKGMLTIIIKLLNLVGPLHAYFGEKDYQQLLLVKKMVAALFIPTTIVGCETIRAEDKLAMSSRNNRLTADQRQKAAHFPALLQSGLPPTAIVSALTELGFKVDYIEDKWQRRLGAVWIDEVRLIDNMPQESFEPN